MELCVGGAGNHAPDIAERLIATQADRAVGEPEPDRALRLHAASQRAVVDDLAPDRGYAARALESVALYQHAAARGRRGGMAAAVHLSKGEQHLKEEDEGRDQ